MLCNAKVFSFRNISLIKFLYITDSIFTVLISTNHDFKLMKKKKRIICITRTERYRHTGAMVVVAKCVIRYPRILEVLNWLIYRQLAAIRPLRSSQRGGAFGLNNL